MMDIHPVMSRLSHFVSVKTVYLTMLFLHGYTKSYFTLKR